MGYWLYPAQPPVAGRRPRLGPPWTASCRLVWGDLGVPAAASMYENGSGLVNLVAAMPSLHASFPFMLLLFFWPAGWLVRIGLGAYTLAMAFTLVYGGEHFVADIIAGWAVAALAYGLVATALRATARGVQWKRSLWPMPRRSAFLQHRVAERDIA